MRSLLVLPLIAALALSACKKDAVVAKDESAESVAKKVAASSIKPLPGRWESTVKMERVDIEGLPPQAKDMLAKQMAAASSISTCLTPEQANRPDGGFFAGGAKGCTYKSFVMADGKVDGDLACGPEMGNRTTKIAGTYDDSSYAIKVDTTAQGPTGKPMTMVMTVTSRRVGECTGKEDITAEDVRKMEESVRSMEAKRK